MENLRLPSCVLPSRQAEPSIPHLGRSTGCVQQQGLPEHDNSLLMLLQAQLSIASPNPSLHAALIPLDGMPVKQTVC